MTDGRRTLRFASLDEVMPEVERLLGGCTTVGHWSFAQICRHLSTVMRRVVDLPATTPHDPAAWVSPDRKRQVFETGLIPEGLPAPVEIIPTQVDDARQEAERLRSAVAYYQASPGPAIPHRLFGPLSKEEWDQLQCIHCAHHLSFAVPTAP